MESKELKFTRRNFIKQSAQGVLGASLGLAAIERFTSQPKLKQILPNDSSRGKPSDENFWRVVRQQFPLTHDRIYFNNGGLGPSPRVVIDTVYQAMLNYEAISETGHERISEVRKKAALFLNADEEEIAFTRNTTEGMNIIARGLPLKRGDEVLLSTHEHPGGAMPWLGLAKDTGIKVRLFEPALTDEENLRRIEEKVNKRTKVISIDHITCTTGLKFPAKEVAKLAHSKGIFLVLDGAHPPGMLPVDLHDIGCDFYATSGHKWLMGPKGTGLVYVSKRMFDVWRPTQIGAYSDSKYDLDKLLLEYKRAASASEYGTRNTPLALGLGAAMDFLSTIGMERVAARGAALANYLKTGLQKIPKVKILTPIDSTNSASIVTFKIIGEDYRKVQDAMHREKIRIRPVGEHHLDANRVSTHVYNNFEELNQLIAALKEIAKG